MYWNSTGVTSWSPCTCAGFYMSVVSSVCVYTNTYIYIYTHTYTYIHTSKNILCRYWNAASVRKFPLIDHKQCGFLSKKTTLNPTPSNPKPNKRDPKHINLRSYQKEARPFLPCRQDSRWLVPALVDTWGPGLFKLTLRLIGSELLGQRAPKPRGSEVRQPRVAKQPWVAWSAFYLRFEGWKPYRNRFCRRHHVVLTFSLAFDFG